MMNLDAGTMRVYTCPMCGVDTPHTVCGRRGDRYAVICSECTGGSIVGRDDLEIHQSRWEEELQAIIDSLEREGIDGVSIESGPDDGGDDDAGHEGDGESER